MDGEIGEWLNDLSCFAKNLKCQDAGSVGFDDRIDCRDECCWDGLVGVQHHDRFATGCAASYMHEGDVDIVLAQERADVANDARLIVVPGEQEMPQRPEVDPEVFDSDDVGFSGQDAAPYIGVLPCLTAL